MAETGSAGTMKDWGTGLQITGGVWRFGGEVGGAWSSYYQTKANGSMQRTNAQLTRNNAKSHREDAKSASRYAGDVQRAGEEAAVNRYLQLGQDVGRIYAGAAGGNIDVSSRTVKQAESAARLMANRDVAAINRSAAQAANRYVDEARNARLAYVSDMAAGRMMDIGAKYQNRVARSNAQMSMWSAAGGLMANTALAFR